ICLNVGAEPYLAALLAGANTLIDLRGHGGERIRRLSRWLQQPLPQPLYALSPGELAAMTWITETATQRRLLSEDPGRSLAIDFDEVLENVPEGLGAVAAYFGLGFDEQSISRVARSQTLQHYSKAPELAYSPGMRSEILAASRREHAAEIRKGLAWIELMS